MSEGNLRRVSFPNIKFPLGTVGFLGTTISAKKLYLLQLLSTLTNFDNLTFFLTI